MRMPGLMLGSVAVIGALSVGLSLRSAGSARSAVERAASRDKRVAADVMRLRELRVATEIAHLGPIEQSVIYERVRRCLAAVGVNGSRFEGVSRQTIGEHDRSTADARRAKRLSQTVALRLMGLTPSELGAFLGRWERMEPVWRITRIELTGDERVAAEHPGPFRIELEMTASYLDTRALPPEEVARMESQR